MIFLRGRGRGRVECGGWEMSHSGLSYTPPPYVANHVFLVICYVLRFFENNYERQGIFLPGLCIARLGRLVLLETHVAFVTQTEA